MSKILQNAVEAIQVGAEDFTSHSSARAKSSVRNLYAGLLLLTKEKLRRMTPLGCNDAYVYEQIIPDVVDGHTPVKPKSTKRSVYYDTIKKRFGFLGLSLDWKMIERIKCNRDNIEHLYTDDATSVIRGIVSDVFIVIRDIAVEMLKEDPSGLFGQHCWQILLNNNEVYAKEKQKCVKTYHLLDRHGSEYLCAALGIVMCPECGSDLIVACSMGDDLLADVSCTVCAHNFSLGIDEIVGDYYSTSVLSDGGIDSGDVVECPQCGESTYICPDDMCCVCGYSREFKECPACYQSIGEDEQDLGGICSRCHNKLMKDD